MKKQSTGANGKRGISAESAKRSKRSAVNSTTRSGAGKNGVVTESKEERERRLAKREALTIRAFQMAYDNHHQK
jgi:hypothetical protein